MGHNANLNKYEVRTDLAIELVKEGVNTRKVGDVKVTNITLDESQGAEISKKAGTYITIEFPDITDYDNSEKIKTIFTEELKKLLETININEKSTCLVIGLGNEKTTPDAVGPLTISKTIVTNHLYVYGQLEEGFRRVFALSPGVMGETGIETSDLIKGVVDKIEPDFVITVDALASSSIERVNKTIQMTDAGINPGSGVGNKRKEISRDTIGVPVIAVGVPTVVDAASIVSDTINYMYKNFAYTKANIDNPAQKLKVKVNYLNKDVEIHDDDKKNLFGIVGSLSDVEVKSLIYEVLNPVGYNLMVTPKEEDFIVEKVSDVISGGINGALHRNVEENK
ncbi:MAG: GPR endopeptidase [Bacilli bacterium]